MERCCGLLLLCIPTVVALTVFQHPRAVSLTQTNMSVEIVCSSSSRDPLGLYLQRKFHGEEDGKVAFLSLDGCDVRKSTIAADFVGRVDVRVLQQGHGCGITLKMSILGLKDTNLYYCIWEYLNILKLEKLESNGTIIIVREKHHSEHCDVQRLDRMLIALGLTTTFVIIGLGLLGFGAVTWRRIRVKKQYSPARHVTTRPQPRSQPYRLIETSQPYCSTNARQPNMPTKTSQPYCSTNARQPNRPTKTSQPHHCSKNARQPNRPTKTSQPYCSTNARQPNRPTKTSQPHHCATNARQPNRPTNSTEILC